MRLNDYLNERKGKYFAGVTFIDVDETLAHTMAKILVKDKDTDEVIRELSNQEFNSYEKKENEYFDFQQFGSGELFRKTSIPIKKTVKRIKRMIKMLKKNYRESKIIFLTARKDFEDKKEFLQGFRDQGIDIDFKSNVYIERAGNVAASKGLGIPKAKKQIIMKYLKEGIYRRVRMIDDYTGNLKEFLSIADNLSSSIIDKVRKNADVPEDSDEPIMQFFALHIDKTGNLSLYGKKEVK